MIFLRTSLCDACTVKVKFFFFMTRFMLFYFDHTYVTELYTSDFDGFILVVKSVNVDTTSEKLTAL